MRSLELAKVADDEEFGECLITQDPPNSTSRLVVFVHDNFTCALFKGSISRFVGFSGIAVKPIVPTVVSVGLALFSPKELIV